MKVVRLSARHTSRLYPQEIFLVLISVRGWSWPQGHVWPEGLCQWKIPMTPLGIDPATFQSVVQCLNHCATACCFWCKQIYKTKQTISFHCYSNCMPLNISVVTQLPTNLILKLWRQQISLPRVFVFVFWFHKIQYMSVKTFWM
jgi:hypothetical protein